MALLDGGWNEAPVWRSVKTTARRKISNAVRDYVFERDGFVCQICRKRTLRNVRRSHPMYPSIDHVIPLKWGGSHNPENLQTAHRGCNSTRGHAFRLPTTPDEYERFVAEAAASRPTFSFGYWQTVSPSRLP